MLLLPPTIPYVTAAEFAAHPTYLDLDDLRINVDDPAAQTAELVNVLLMASGWADRTCNQVLAAHSVALSTRARADDDGNLMVGLPDTPFLALQSLAYGRSITAVAAVASLPACRVDRGKVLLVPTAGAVTPGSAVWVDLTYTAGWANTTVTADAVSGATTLTVADPTGILPGATYRLWEPGAEEAVTVSPAWAPPAMTVPPAPTAVPLAAPTLYAHTPGGGWSGMPADMRLAVINYGVSQLLRPDTAAEDSYPDTRLSSGTRATDPRKDGSGLVAEAERLLNPYARRV